MKYMKDEIILIEDDVTLLKEYNTLMDYIVERFSV